MAVNANAELIAELNTLKIQRAAAKGSIKRIKNQFDNVTHYANSIELECRLDIVNSYVKQLMAYQCEIERIDPDDNKRPELEELSVLTKSKLMTLLGGHRRQSNADLNMSLLPPPSKRLPNLKLPSFNGELSNYKEFISLFFDLVHNEPSISNIEKFNHLLSCLSGEALRTVQSLHVTGDNYQKAIDLLKERYDNKTLIVFDIIEQMFDVPSMQKQDAHLLRHAVDTVSNKYQSLSSLGTETQVTEAILIHLLLSKVDAATKAKWFDQLDYSQLPTWKQCTQFLIRQCQSWHSARQSAADCNKNKSSMHNHKLALHCSQSNDNKCSCCRNSNHPLHQCETFLGMPVPKRFEHVKRAALCLNCLRKGHSATKCRSSHCRVCKMPHHTLLHRQEVHQVHVSTTDEQPSTSRINVASMPAVMAATTDTATDVVLLATAVVKLLDAHGCWHDARALLDSGSQISCITSRLAHTLKLKKRNCSINVHGIGRTNMTATNKTYTTVHSNVSNYKFNAEFVILPSIAGDVPSANLSAASIKIPSDITLADPTFYKKQKLDILLGADVFYDLLCAGRVQLHDTSSFVVETHLGWIVAGRCRIAATSPQLITQLSAVATESETMSTLDSRLARFWEIEEPVVDACEMLPEHAQCKVHYDENTKVLNSGKFEVRLPFIENPSVLGMSYETAKRRYLALERRLCKTPETRKLYNEFMLEYLSLGHMTKVDGPVPPSHYFIPHQVVLRMSSETTKLRVVFDASSKSSTGRSLNDILMVGPTIQKDLYCILLKFRTYLYVMSADVVKMYRQILVDKQDRQYQLILWREHQNDALSTYELNTVTYGTAPAPYLAIRSLVELGKKHEFEFPNGARAIINDFYVDDMLTGAHDIKTLLQVKEEVVSIMSKADWQLSKWKSNAPLEYTSDSPLQLDTSEYAKALGIVWYPKQDTWSYIVDLNGSETITKRSILSLSSRLFDPLGLVCPLITSAKILLQELWLQRLDWDETIPTHLHSSWKNIYNSIQQATTFSIPRHVGFVLNADVQIHCFCDASSRAYGFCVYMRTQTDDNVVTRLLTAKSRVAPVKTKSIPRLELCAAHIMSKWWKTYVKYIPTYSKVYFWSDSEIVLLWIKRHPAQLVSFVANRVTDIQDWTTEVRWQHVATKDNPADLVSRGCDAPTLQNSIWFNGPSFLSRPSSEWPVSRRTHVPDSKLELRQTAKILCVHTTEPTIVDNLCSRVSSFHKLIHIVAYIYRVKTCKMQKYNTLIITAQEYKMALYKLIELIQLQEFNTELKALHNKQTVKSASVQKLTPFLCEMKAAGVTITIMRVGGRLLHAPLAYNAKFPALLPARHKFGELYAIHLHRTNCHAGPKSLLALLRQTVWCINARHLVRKIVRNCIHCFKYKPVLMNQIMGNLPGNRLHASRAFETCGVDFCGPFYVSYRIRGRPPYKVYLAVFVCFVTKAVHLELVGDLSSDAFLLTFKRFIGRRGCPTTIHCDNGTNFVGASGALKELSDSYLSAATKDAIHNLCAANGATFRFIPPRAPHFGGLWEAAVKSAKTLLLRTAGKANLTTEELHTLVVDVEAILNSRPLVASNDPNDGQPLTPAHFLIGCSLKEAADGSCPPKGGGFFKRWRQISCLKSTLWSSFQREYVAGLQQRHKWTATNPNVKVDDLVVVCEDGVAPLSWTVGRVVTTYPGADGKVRVVDVRTPTGLLKRPIKRIAILPIEHNGK